MRVKSFMLGALLAAALVTTATAAPGDAVCPALAEVTDPDWAFLRGTFVGNDGFMFTPHADFRALEERKLEPIERLSNALKEKGTQLVQVVLPHRILVYPDSASSEVLARFDYDAAAAEADYYNVLEELNARGIIAPDMLTPLREAAAKHQVYFKRDVHWTSYGAQAVAAAVAEAIKADEGFPNTGLEFVTTPLTVETQFGNQARVAMELCDSHFDRETVMRFETNPVEDPGLLDDVPPAEIALVGTSYSFLREQDFFNFAGSISQFTGEDVINFGRSGSQVFSSMVNFLNSDFFHETPPAYVVWEQNRGMKFISDQISRQMIALSRGSCEGASTVMPAVKGEEIALESNLPLASPNHYLTLQYEDLSVAIHKIRLSYADGKSETLVMDKGKRADITGYFATELSRTNTSGLVGFSLAELPETVTGDVTVTVCSAVASD